MLLGAKGTILTHRPLIMVEGGAELADLLAEWKYTAVGTAGINEDMAFAPQEWL